MWEKSPKDKKYVEDRLATASKEVKSKLQPMRDFFAELNQDEDKLPSDIRMRRGLSERWLSDALAWLLDVKGSHELGVRFANSFLSRIAKLRSGVEIEGRTLPPLPPVPYRRLSSMLKSGSSGRGVNPSKFGLRNAAVFREFSMIRKSKNCPVEGAMAADVVMFDLDLSDSLFVVVENKLFGNNSRGQLGSYHVLTEDKYHRASVREYVYLTLHGSEPKEYDTLIGDKPDKAYLGNWIRMSWTKDILPMLEKLTKGREGEFTDLSELIAFLRWLDKLTNPAAELSKAIDEFGNLIVSAVTDCLWWELYRLDGDSNSYWYTEKDDASRTRRLYYTKLPARPVNVHLWPPSGVALSSKSGKRVRYDRLVLRLGAHHSQMYNLIEVATRDLVRQHFPDPEDHEGRVRRSKRRNRFMEAYRPLFKFLNKHHLALPVLLHRASRAEVSSENAE